MITRGLLRRWIPRVTRLCADQPREPALNKVEIHVAAAKDNQSSQIDAVLLNVVDQHIPTVEQCCQDRPRFRAIGLGHSWRFDPSKTYPYEPPFVPFGHQQLDRISIDNT